MARVITFSRAFPSYHSKKNNPTFFVEKIYNSLGDIIPARKNGYYFEQICNLNPKASNGERLKFYDSISRGDFKPKHHTIRAGHNWSVGEKFSPRIWSGRPYFSKQIIIAPDIEILKIFDFKIVPGCFYIDNRSYIGETEADFELLERIAENDGLDRHDLLEWFKHPKPFEGQIICWNKDVNY